MKTTIKRVVLVGLWLTSPLLNVATAGDWPCWRGPTHNGVSQETGWWEDGRKHKADILWERKIGFGYASMAVADGRLFAMGSVTKGAAHDVLYCLDPNSGDILWTHEYATPRYNDQYHRGGPCATPTVVDSNVYILSKYGEAYCLDVNDGRVHWTHDVFATTGAIRPTWEFSSSPFVQGSLVVYNIGTHGLALNAADGSLAWQTGTEECGHATPVPFKWQNKQLLLISGEKVVAAIDPETGQKAWEFPWANKTKFVPNITDPVVDGNNIYVSEGYNTGVAMFEVTAEKVVQRWYKRNNMRTFVNTAVLREGFLYGANNYNDSLVCLDTTDGYVMWRQRGRYHFGSVVLADNKLIALSDNGELAVVNASPSRYEELGRWSILRGECWTSPVLANGKIYARNAQGTLVCVQLEPLASRGNR